MIDPDEVEVVTTESVVRVRGAVFDYPPRVNGYTGEVTWPAGRVTISLGLLDELCEADNSWGAGGAFLMPDRLAQHALASAGLIEEETRGGVYTTKQQREALRAIIERST